MLRRLLLAAAVVVSMIAIFLLGALGFLFLHLFVLLQHMTRLIH